MIRIKKVDIESPAQINQFVNFPFKLYSAVPQWVPPIIADIKIMLNKKKHPFYEHSDGDFFLAYKDEKIAGRLGVLENKPFNKYHQKKKAQFYFFDCIDDQEVANKLFEAAFDWAKNRGLDEMVGPKGLSPFDGYGIQIEGFEIRQMMTMMNYNFPYYQTLMENLGFDKDVDFVSCYLDLANFSLPEKIHEISKRVQERGNFQVKRFKNKRELREWAPRIGEAYNKTFIQNWEYYPLTKNEIDFALDNILMVANPKLIKIITHNDEVVGFLFGFPDVSAALQRGKGKLTPWAVIDLLLDMKRTNQISLNGVGVLSKYHGRGANALLYSEIYKTIADFGYEHAELTQVSNTAIQMRKDLINVGGKEYKNHRVFTRKI